MSRLIIKGGKNLKGVWRLSGNKNEALALIAASLLFENGLTLKNVPKIKDVEVMAEIADSLTKQKKSKKLKLPAELSSKIRGSLLFLGPLLALKGRAEIPASGGDKIGLRRIDAHLEVSRAFGATISRNEIILPKEKLSSGGEIKVWLSEPSVTATENALMLAASRQGKTIIKNAASEPHVMGLGLAFQKGGAKIKGLGTNLVEVRGAKKLKKTTHELSEDFMELGGVLVLSAIFKGKIKVKVKEISEYKKIFEILGKFGKKIVNDNGELRVINNSNGRGGLEREIHEISDGPWPNLPSDLMSPLIVLATQCKGNYLFHEKMFESRLYFIDQLKTLGAKVILCDPHRVLISGPSQLHGSHMASPDIRAGMALVIAALTAKGVSYIDNAEEIDRGYENLVEKLKSIGADIKRE